MAFEHNLQRMWIPGEEDTDASAADHFTWKPEKPLLVRDFGFVITEAVVNTSVAAVVSLDHTPSGGSRTEKATLSIANAAVVGTEFITYEGTALSPFVVEEGDTLHFEHKTAGTGGSTAGKGYYVLYYEWIPDGTI